MRGSAALSLVLGLALPSIPQALENHIDAADFPAAAERHLGAHVTVDNCHLVFATEEAVTCIGLSAKDVAGEVRPLSRLLVRVASTEARSLLRALALCDGGLLDDACHVSVSGVVQDLSREFGIRDQPLLGLREGTIAWPD